MLFNELDIEIGINPLTWTNDDCPELGDDIPLEQALTEARLAGYTGMELGRKFPRDASILAPLLKAHGLKLISGWYSGKLLQRSVEEEIESLQAHVHLLKALDCQVLIFAETTGCIHGMAHRPLSKRPKILPDDWPIFTEKLDKVAYWLNTQGLTLSYHHHMGTVIESQQEIEQLMRATKWTKLLLDSGHLSYAKGNALTLIEQFGHRISHVHCKDTRSHIRKDALHKDIPFIEAVKRGVFTVPGDGEIDFTKILEALLEQSYKGWLVVEAEQDPKKAHPLTYAKMGYKHLSNILLNLEAKTKTPA